MEYLDKLDFQFTAGQVLKAELMNIMKDRINEVVDAVNTLPETNAKIESNQLHIEALENEKVDLTQEEFEAMLAAGTLDPTKEYNTYEEE